MKFHTLSTTSLLPVIMIKANVLNVDQQAGGKSLNLALMSKFASFNGYGCYCHFGSAWRKGRGQPVDQFDKLCRDLIHGYECIHMDAVDENTSCVPYETRYLEPLNIDENTTDESIYADCTLENSQFPDGDCRVRSCLVEAFYVRDTARLLETQNLQLNDIFKPENGFDFDGICNSGAGPQEKACCGEYPNRHAFRTTNNESACCQGKKIYNTFMYECCEDGSVSFGSC